MATETLTRKAYCGECHKVVGSLISRDGLQTTEVLECGHVRTSVKVTPETVLPPRNVKPRHLISGRAMQYGSDDR